MNAITKPETSHISISATSHALLAMEQELQELQAEEERLIFKRRLVLQKMASCHATIKALLLTTGAKYELMAHPKFPALNGE